MKLYSHISDLIVATEDEVLEDIVDQMNEDDFPIPSEDMSYQDKKDFVCEELSTRREWFGWCEVELSRNLEIMLDKYDKK